MLPASHASRARQVDVTLGCFTVSDVKLDHLVTAVCARSLHWKVTTIILFDVQTVPNLAKQRRFTLVLVPLSPVPTDL